MKCAPVRLIAAVLTLAGFGPLAAADRTVIVNSQVTKLGQHLDPAGPDAPVHYQVMTQGFVELGSAIAGEDEPAREAFVKLVLGTLHGQGYLPATEDRQPAIALALTWGSLRQRPEAAVTYLTGPALPMAWKPRAPAQLYQTAQPFRTTEGGQTVLAAINHDLRAKIAGAVDDDFYFLTVSAYDWASAFRGRPVLFWQTRVACPAAGLSATDALTLCVRAAKAAVGTATDGPRWSAVTTDDSAPVANVPFDLSRLVVHDFSARQP